MDLLRDEFAKTTSIKNRSDPGQTMNKRHLASIASVLLAVILVSSAIAFVAPESKADELESSVQSSKIGKVVEDFTLQSHRGRKWALSDFQDKRAVVIVFLGTECPLAKLYGPRLAELQSEFGDAGLAIVGINSNTQDSMTELTAYAERHKLSFPLLKDVGNRVADALGAERTPEVFLLDQQRKVRYHGRIDDQYGVGYARDKLSRRDLALAVEQLLAGKPVARPETEAVGCVIGRVKQIEPTGDVTYCDQIVRILNQHCVECHRPGEIAPFTLTDYDDIVGWEDTILEVIADNRMPPWFANPQHGQFANDARLSAEDKRLIRTWVANGMPKGDPSQQPPAPEFVQGWRMPQPDEVIHMDDQPFRVPAQGVVDYQYFVVDPGWDKDQYICAAEARPDNPSVVHHIIAYLMPPKVGRQDFKNRTMLVAYAPGSPPQVLPDGIAIHVPAGSKILFEMHYTPNGAEQLDHSYVGFKYIEKSRVRKQLHGRMAIEINFRIPPNVSDHVVKADYRLLSDELLLQMSPHMHVRGKSFRYEAFYPDGKQEVLLDVPKYDFNWQLAYRLAEPKLLPKGTRILCTATYDNSEDNPVNPNPNVAVRWGDQSWEEMMIGFFDVIPADVPSQPTGVRNATVDPSGQWKWKRPTHRRKIDERLSLEIYDDRIEGTLQSDDRYYPVKAATLDGDKLSFQVTVKEVGQDLTLDFEAKVYPNQLKGNVRLGIGLIGKSYELPWRAERVEEEDEETDELVSDELQ